MEYLVPLLIMFVVVLAVVIGARSLGKRNRTTMNPVRDGESVPKLRRRDMGREITREDAVAASARLSPESHQLVYSLIAQHQILNAVREYRKATREGLGESAAAVAALAQFPQPAPQLARGVAKEVAQEPAQEPAPPLVKESALTVEDIIKAAPEVAQKPATATNTYRFRAIVSQGDDVREVASTRLNEEIFARIRELAQAGDYEGAAQVLREYVDIGVDEATEFVSMIAPDED